MACKGVALLFLLRILEHIVAEKHRHAVKEDYAVRRPRLTYRILGGKWCLVGRPVCRTARLMQIDAQLHLRIIDLRGRNIGDSCAALCGAARRTAFGKRGFARADAACYENDLPH